MRVHESMIALLRENPSSPGRKYDNWRYVVYKSKIQTHLLRKNLDAISASNGFHLLVDFIHLNSKGADIIAEHIAGFLKAPKTP